MQTNDADRDKLFVKNKFLIFSNLHNIIFYYVSQHLFTRVRLFFFYYY